MGTGTALKANRPGNRLGIETSTFRQYYSPVAQLVVASDFDSEGSWFESKSGFQLILCYNKHMMNINMKQMKSIDQSKIGDDNIKWYNNIMKNKGKIVSLDYRGYIDFLNEMNVFYTISKQ